MAYPKPYLGDQDQEEDDHIDGVAGNSWSVIDSLPGLWASWYTSEETVLSSHTHGGGIIGMLERKVDQCRSGGIPFGVELSGDIVIITLVDVIHIVLRWEKLEW